MSGNGDPKTEVKYEAMAKVASKIDDYKFVINRGSDHGVAIGAKYLIFGLGDDVIDPDTGENLGKLEIVRGRAKVIHVQSRVATLESSETIYSPGRRKVIKRDAGGSSLSALMLNMPRVEEIEEGGENTPAKIPVVVGDLARPI